MESSELGKYEFIYKDRRQIRPLVIHFICLQGRLWNPLASPSNLPSSSNGVKLLKLVFSDSYASSS